MNKQNGFTLIELMISSLVALILMGGIMNLFITTNRSATLSDALSQNQETGRFAMEYLTKFIRRAGYVDSVGVTIPAVFDDFEGGGPIITCEATDDEEDTAMTKACSSNDSDITKILGDRLGISYAVSNDSTRSCTGALLPATSSYYVDVFWVVGDETSDKYRDLVCSTYDVSAVETLQPEAVSIINHVERFEFQVGLASDIIEQNSARYVNLTTAKATPDYVLLLRSIRIAILTTSQDIEATSKNKLQSKKQRRTYSLLDAKSFDKDDGALRNIFMNTIELTNLIESSTENSN